MLIVLKWGLNYLLLLTFVHGVASSYYPGDPNNIENIVEYFTG